jgi:uncharacterized membrane protein (DUF485 family)
MSFLPFGQRSARRTRGVEPAVSRHSEPRWCELSIDSRTPADQSRDEPPLGDAYLAVAQSEEFATLRKALRGFVFPMTAAFFLWYALYVLLSAYARDFMSTKVIGNINVALIFGLLQFVSTFGIAWYYARYASRRLDPTAERIRARLESGTVAE